MACAASSSAILSPNLKSFTSKSHPSMAASSISLPKPFCQFLTASSNFNGLRKSFQPSRSFSSRRSVSSNRSFVVCASAEFPLVGNVAPDFEAEAVFDQEFINVKLSDYKGKKYVILFFYPLDFTFVCPTEITAFSDRHAEFEKLNTEIIGVSIDSVFSHLAWVQTDRKSGGLGDLKYLLVSDVTKSIAKAYNVLIPDQGIALRGLFIIDKEGVIQHSTINNLAIGRSVDETLRTLQALQYVQEMQENPDEVCPKFPTFSSKTTTIFPLKPSKIQPSPSSPHLSSSSTSSSSSSSGSIPQKLIPSNPEFREKTLFLDSIGFDSISQLPPTSIANSSSLSELKFLFDYLTSLGFTPPQLRRITTMCPEILSLRFHDTAPVFGFLLREVKVRAADIPRVICRRPRLLVSDVETRLRPTLYFLQSIGIHEVHKHTDLLSASVEDKFMPKIHFFEKVGFAYPDSVSMFRRFPPLFCYSVRDNFKPKFNYFVVEMRRDLKELKEFPQYFSFSLEKRIKPRHQSCVESGVHFPLPVMLKMKEEEFRKRLDVYCNSSMPRISSPFWVCAKDL